MSIVIEDNSTIINRGSLTGYLKASRVTMKDNPGFKIVSSLPVVWTPVVFATRK